jgi:alpha,alpha-trehalase
MEAVECIMLLDPDELISTPTNTFGFFSSVSMAFQRLNCTYRQFWAAMGDAPNAWPPHQSMAMHALWPRALPDNGSSGAIP